MPGDALPVSGIADPAALPQPGSAADLLALAEAPLDSLLGEARRQIAVCNGCRYCEGLCAVFPAMERLPLVGQGDLTYLANLCHDCRSCYQACMYTPPHEFAIEIPQLLSEVRQRSYEHSARPRWLTRAFVGGPRSLLALTLVGSAAYLGLAAVAGNLHHALGQGNAASIYEVIPYAPMVASGLLLALFVVVTIGWGVRDFWQQCRPGTPTRLRHWLLALRDVATMRWLRGGGGGCFYPDPERPSALRRRFHHAVSYGFMLALAATTLAAICQDLLGEKPPFPVYHPVVLLGLIGGVGIVTGASGLLWLKLRAAPMAAARERIQGATFIISLDVVALTGLALLAFRTTSALGPLLIVHLGCICMLYLTAPYGKFVHVVYRSAALLRSAAERVADAEAATAESAP